VIQKITEGVEFNVIAREWRAKWSPDNEKASLQEMQKLLDENKDALKALPGFVGLQRMVCGECMDIRIITRLNAPEFKQWAEKSFAPEATFLEKAKTIPGISQIETQTYTLMDM